VDFRTDHFEKSAHCAVLSETLKSGIESDSLSPWNPSLFKVELPLLTPMLAQWKQRKDLQNPKNKAA